MAVYSGGTAAAGFDDRAGDFRYSPAMTTEIERDDMCFCCGKGNDRGLRMTIAYPEPGTAESSVEIPRWYTGWRGLTHGGFLSTILDEVMAHACISAGSRAVTGELTVRYVKPIDVGSLVKAVGRVTESRGRVLATAGSVADGAGAILAEATARFIRI